MDRVASPDPDWRTRTPASGSSAAPFRLHNVGNGAPVPLRRVVELLERALGRKARLRMLPLQPGDVPDTFADVDSLADAVGYRPATPIEIGIERFVSWYRAHYGAH